MFVRWDNLERQQAPRACCPAWGRRRFARSMLRRRSGSAFTRSRRARGSTRCQSDRGCRSAGRSTRTAAALMPASYLLRPPDPHLSRPQRARGLRARDRRQGQRARAGPRRARQAVVEGRARRARDQHRPVPVGRAPLRADAGDLGGDARLRQPLLGADEVAAAAPRHRADEGALRADRVRRQPLDPDARGEGVAPDRAAHPAPAQAARGGRRAGAGGDPGRGADRAADSRRQRLAGPDRGAGASWRERPAPRASPASGCTCAARCARSGSTGCASTAPT